MKIYRQVQCSDRLPNASDYDSYDNKWKRFHVFTLDGYHYTAVFGFQNQSWQVESNIEGVEVDSWLEEIELPTEEEINAERRKICGHSTIRYLTFNKTVEWLLSKLQS